MSGYPTASASGGGTMDWRRAELIADVIYQIGALQGLAAAAGDTGDLRQAARRALQHHRRRRPAGGRGHRRHPRGRCRRCPGGPRRRADPRARPRSRPDASSPRPSPTAPTRRRARSSRAAETGAVLHDPDLVAARMLRLATEGTIEAVDGSVLRLDAQSICVHGDSPAAVAMARQHPRRGSSPRASRSAPSPRPR